MKLLTSLFLTGTFVVLLIFLGFDSTTGKFEAFQPSVAEAQSLVPEACSGSNGGADCPAGDEEYRPDGYGSCEFVSLVNNVIQFLIKMSALLAVLVFIYAGFIMVSSRGDSALIEGAKKLFANVLIGFVILLAAFLIINTIIGILVGGASGGITWQTIECKYANESAAAIDVFVELKQYEGVVLVMSSNEGYYPDAIIRGTAGGSTYQLGDCSPENLRRLGMTPTQANTFSCIARPESGCNLNADNPISTARGVFQVLRGYNDRGHNLNFPECTKAAQAAGYTVSGNLNCSQAFSGGHRKPGVNPLADACDAAASNLACNVRASLELYNDGGKYNHWLGNKGKNEHQAQRACVAKYDSANFNASRYPF